jgi:CDP-glucose 4,6-dehydratase
LIDFGIFKGKRVLLTGHSGFKGSWLLAILERAGANVKGLSLPPERESHFEALGYYVEKRKDEFFDIREFAKVQSLVREFKPQIIFHLAAQPIVRESFRIPRETFEVNVMGGVNILDAARDAKDLAALIFITSDKAYENVEWEWGYRENDRLGGIDAYSASKAAAEITVGAYRRSLIDKSRSQVSTVRAGNVIGGGDWSIDRIIPDIVRSVRESRPVLIRNPESTRPWQHVLEPLSGYLLLAQRMLEGQRVQEAYNFGPDLSENITVLDVAEKLLRVLGRGSVEVTTENDKIHEAKLLQLNCDRAKIDLGWRPRLSFEETINMTGEWYRNQLDSPSKIPITQEQISKYFQELP